MKRLAAVAVLVLAIPPCALLAERVRAVGPGPRPGRVAAFGDPYLLATPAERALFNAGKVEFEEVESIETGLGPVFNSRACSECHLVPASGGSSERLVTRIGKVTDGKFDPLTQFGGSLLQARGIGKMDGTAYVYGPELVPTAATIVALRRSTPVFGLGLVDATPDSTFVALAAEQAARNDGTAGRVHMVDNIAAGMKTAGKFGWKAQIPTLFQFSGEAYLNEMGITNPEFPSENCPSGDCTALQHNPLPALNDTGKATKALADFMTFLAPPPRGPVTADAKAGEEVFNRINCTACHVSTLQTGSNSNPVFDRVTYHPYSDFLLHDMGTLGDGIEQGSATGKEIRTAPLWGLRFVTTLLHDGRTTSLEAAITAHDGQARASRDAFVALNESDRAKLLAFLKSL